MTSFLSQKGLTCRYILAVTVLAFAQQARVRVVAAPFTLLLPAAADVAQRHDIKVI